MPKATKTAEHLLNKVLPLQTTNDILYRGMWSGPVVHEGALRKLPFLQRQASNLLMKILRAHFIEKRSRQPIPTFVDKGGVRTRSPDYVYSTFLQLSKTHWLLRTIFRAHLTEVINPGWKIESRFGCRCTHCGKEYDRREVEKCEVCGGADFKVPDAKQLNFFQEIVKEPSPGRTFTEFIRSTLWYLLALDDFYWEIGHSRHYDSESGKVKREARGVRVLDASVTFPEMDEFGNFNSPEFFCPACYSEQMMKTKMDTYLDIRTLRGKIDVNDIRCKQCGEKMVRTAYKQIIDSKTHARFAEDEVIHQSSSRVDPDAFGLSKIIACVKLLYILEYMDEYNLQIYSHGHANMILGVPGADAQKVEEIKEYVMQQMRTQNRQDVKTGERAFSLEPILIFLGLEQGQDLKRVEIMTPLDHMQSIDYYRLYVEKVCGLFGVLPTFAAMTGEGGRTITPRMELDVQNRETRKNMKDITDPLNDLLLPRLGISDWILKFGLIESRDMLRDAQIKQTNAMAASLLLQSGFKVEMTEDGTSFKVSPLPETPPQPRSRLEGGRIPQTHDGAPQRTMPGGGEGGIPLLEPEVAPKEEKE